ncbi:MAG TPA: type II toxin-antitoxin system YafQ family toxin [Kiritimatiellia bacterium]|jgi:mRNA interferase YafQ|nr:type II toxin-antitoxin system YafQ family toxin [Kiritimatiellia bacterium]HOE36519.1 type II toxin-antitoxin system YafQ family toxin [Kiritimatiellia bacterium]HOR73578.1 type II toxin-antitoxin system YafQ family toxin [Kiritimatiellia bacterium]HOU58049.1 type II toxin-antitoxin system YafQ family toxin [Kiritimatiellia bacterium]HPK69106.1 type II toxin-antitoxin system YafQ family toxin [Kiritimatiellia bacterium]
MYTPVFTKQFAKDIKRCQRRGKEMEKFKLLAHTLLAGRQLDPIHRDHKLTGSMTGRRDCHIESDWILIYRIAADQLIFERMGTHSDLFKK